MKARYGWYLSQILVLLFANWGYSVLGSVFTKAPQEYQWILAFLVPLVQHLFSKLLYKTASKAAGSESEGKRSVKMLNQHYVITKNTIFLAVIVGGVSTPTTSFCIMAIDFTRAMYSGWKIINKYKSNSDIKGKM